MWYIRLGNRIWGPVSNDDLQTLHRRGEFTQIHQISLDQVSWRPATELIHSWTNPNRTTEVWVPTLQASQESWFYCLPNRQQQGPLSREELVAKARQGEIQAKTLVFGEELGRWVPACEVSFLGLTPPKKDSGIGLVLFAFLTVAVCVATGVGTYVSIRYFQSISNHTTLPHEPKTNTKP